MDHSFVNPLLANSTQFSGNETIESLEREVADLKRQLRRKELLEEREFLKEKLAPKKFTLKRPE